MHQSLLRVTALAFTFTSLYAQPPQNGQRGAGQQGGPPGGFGGPPVIMQALDPNGDRRISKAEIAGVAASLKKLDKDGDGQISQKETGWPPQIQGGGAFPFPPPPPLAAIDLNSDGAISKDELVKATASLKKLDNNNDGQLADTEIMPNFGGGQGRGNGPGGGRQGRGGFGGGQPGGPKQMPEDLKFNDGVPSIPDHATYHKLSYRGPEVMIDTFLAGLEFVKFTIDEVNSEKPQFYFINTKTHRGHPMFARAVGLSNSRGGTNQMKGVLVYRPMLKSPSGKAGLYTYEFEPFDQFPHEMIMKAHNFLVEKMPTLKGNIGYYPRQRGIDAYLRDKAKYDKQGPPVYLDEDLTNADVGYLPLNKGVSFGMLREMQHDERPGPRDVVIYATLPNELSRVAGVITGVRQTPLSHVNLRAVQDGIPNAFITEAAKNEKIKPLVGKYVRYEVTNDGFEIAEASIKDVEAFFKDQRPTEPQIPKRNLSAKKIRGLEELDFSDSDSVGVKAANVAAMRKIKYVKDTVPNGSAIPFYFYDEFMKHNGFYGYASELLKNPEFQNSREVQEAKLKEFRSLIKKGKMPEWMMTSLDELHKSFPDGQSLRCRSSTNNEDLPGFSGAGLYDSCTHKPDEGHFSKSVRQVFASMWNFRAFEEREFYRVDHLAAAMGVLVHPNYKGELSNGVAVTDDILYQTSANYYVNTQVGEDLVTNPDEESVPEELLLAWYKEDGDQIMREANGTKQGEKLLSQQHLNQLRKCLTQIHGKFAKLYGRSADDPTFAMEIEFKITKDNELAIKQARPWVYAKPPKGE